MTCDSPSSQQDRQEAVERSEPGSTPGVPGLLRVDVAQSGAGPISDRTPLSAPPVTVSWRRFLSQGSA